MLLDYGLRTLVPLLCEPAAKPFSVSRWVWVVAVLRRSVLQSNQDIERAVDERAPTRH